MHSAEITEDRSRYVIHDLSTKDLKKAMKDIPTQNAKDNMIEYGLAGVRHFQHFADFAVRSEENYACIYLTLRRRQDFHRKSSTEI